MTRGGPQRPERLYQFGLFRLDAEERRLWRQDEPLQFTPKQFDLLFYFVENAGRVAKKSELLDKVWTDSFVEETTLARNVSWLRQLLGDGVDGKTIIETVPKLGYRFTADVTRPKEDLLIIEEETVQYTRGEVLVTFDRDPKVAGSRPNSEQESIVVSSKPRFGQSFGKPLIAFVAVTVCVLVGIGWVNLSTQTNSEQLNKRANPPVKTLDLSGKSVIKIGSIVNLQNRYPNDGSFLDAWGAVWSKPEFQKVPTETMFVSTHEKPDRDIGSGSWEIVSASGKSNSEPLLVGDRIHLMNMYPNAGYLDACGWAEHLPVFENFSDQTGAVFTTQSPNRDNGTGIWIVRSGTAEDGTPVLEGDSIAVESSYFINDRGINRLSGFLNVTGAVKDIPAFNDYDGAKLVFTQSLAFDQPIPDIWTITVSKAVSE